MTEIERRAAFDKIRYAQLWEDADVLIAALRVQPGDTVVSIASAGDNALALLATGAERVIAVDLNPAQLACVRLRVAAWRALTHAELLELIGSRLSSQRGALLDKAGRGVCVEDQAFWAARRDLVITHGLGGAGKFESYFRIFRRYLLPLVHSETTVQAMLTPKDHGARARFYDETWNSLRWRLLIKTFFSRPMMGRFGRDPAFFDQVVGSVAQHVAEKTRLALVEQDPSTNPYLHWIVTGRHGAALPFALREENFEIIRGRLDRLELRVCTVEALAAEGIKADAFNLSDIFEYMSPPAHEAAYATILDASRAGARIAYWNMMAPRRAPARFADRVRARDDIAAPLKSRDKAFFYRDFVVEDVL